MEKKKVLLFVDRMRVGGIQILLTNLLKYLNKDILTYELLILDDGTFYPLEDRVRQTGVTIHKLKNIWLRKPWDYVSYYKAVKNFFQNHHDYIAVHMNSGPKNFLILKLAKKYHIPVRIAHSHNTGFQSDSKLQMVMGNILKRPLKKAATDCLACSEKAGEWMFGKKSIARGEVSILPNGVALDEFRFSSQIRTRVRDALGVDKQIVLGHVGRFTLQKNHAFLINIFKKIHDIDSNTVLVLVGIGELMDETKEKVEQLGLTSAVQFLGFRRDVAELLQGMDLFLMPSLYEGFPVTGVEAQATGLPCVFSDTITREAKLLEQVEYVGLDKDVEVWAQKVLHLVGTSDRAGCTTLLKRKGFDIRDTAAHLEEIYLKGASEGQYNKW